MLEDMHRERGTENHTCILHASRSAFSLRKKKEKRHKYKEDITVLSFD